MLDASGAQVEYGAEGLSRLKNITTDHVIPELKDCFFRIACDVNNPLCGTNGCSAVFGPQKGAKPNMISKMDQWMQAYAALSKEIFVESNMEYPGAGAAGVKIILEETKLENYIQDADIVITGEGRLDAQAVMGKAPMGVAEIAKKYNKPVLAFSGCVTRDAVICNDIGIDAFFPIIRTIETLEEAMGAKNAEKNIVDTVEQVFRLIKAIDSCWK